MKTSKIKIGDEFGRLKVVRFAQKDKSRKLIWECECVCGKHSYVRSSDLLQGKVRSCGCLLSETSKENILKANEQTRKYGALIKRNDLEMGVGEIQYSELQSFKVNARNRNIEYNVSDEYLWNLFLKQDRKCNISGIPIRFENRFQGCKRTASLDRINSSVGYIEGNLQWVYKDINKMKHAFSMDDLFILCKKIYEFNDLQTFNLDDVELTSVSKYNSGVKKVSRGKCNYAYTEDSYDRMVGNKKTVGLKFLNITTGKVETPSTLTEMSEKYGLSMSSLSHLKNGKIKRHKQWICVN